MKKLTTLLFDVDGTLADTEEIHRQSFNRAFAQAKLDWHWSQALYTELLSVTGGKERIRHYLATCLPEAVLPGDPGEYIAALHAAKTRFYTETVAAGGLPMRPGVERLLREARQAGLRLGIATTTTPANVSALLRHNLDMDAESWFEVIAAGGVVPAKKPAPDIYHYAMQAMGVEAAECLAFEDSANGLHSALAAGLQTLVTVSAYTQHHDFSGAALVLDHLGDPGHPFRVLSGPAYDARMVDVELLHELHS